MFNRFNRWINGWRALRNRNVRVYIDNDPEPEAIPEPEPEPEPLTHSQRVSGLAQIERERFQKLWHNRLSRANLDRTEREYGHYLNEFWRNVPIPHEPSRNETMAAYRRNNLHRNRRSDETLYEDNETLYEKENMPQRKTGGRIKKTEPVLMHTNEYVLPAGVEPTKAQKKKVATIKRKVKSNKV